MGQEERSRWNALAEIPIDADCGAPPVAAFAASCLTYRAGVGAPRIFFGNALANAVRPLHPQGQPYASPAVSSISSTDEASFAHVLGTGRNSRADESQLPLSLSPNLKKVVSWPMFTGVINHLPAAGLPHVSVPT